MWLKSVNHEKFRDKEVGDLYKFDKVLYKTHTPLKRKITFLISGRVCLTLLSISCSQEIIMFCYFRSMIFNSSDSDNCKDMLIMSFCCYWDSFVVVVIISNVKGKRLFSWMNILNWMWSILKTNKNSSLAKNMSWNWNTC